MINTSSVRTTHSMNGIRLFKSVVTAQNVTEVIPMSNLFTSTSSVSGNSSIIADYAAETASVEAEGKDVLNAYAFDNGMQVIERAESVIINNQVNARGIYLNGESEARGALTGLISAFHEGKYSVLEVGFHLARSIEAARAAVRANDVGYLGSTYAGNNAQLLKIKPQVGWISLNIVMGSFQKGNLVVKESPAPKFNESLTTSKARAVFHKHTAIDMILSGMKLIVSPMFKTKGEGEDGRPTLTRDGSRVASFLRSYMRNLEVSPIEASRNAYQAGLKRIYTREMGVVASKINSGEIAIPVVQDAALLIKVGDQQLSMMDLYGKKVIIKKGSVTLRNQMVTPSNIASLLAFAEQFSGVTFDLAPVAAA